MIRRHPPPTRSRPPRGFTLLEVLVALALSTVLMAAVYAGLSLYWRYSTYGQEEVERSQLARVLLRQIELDLRSVIYRGQTTSSTNTTTSTTSSSSSSSGSGSTSSSSSGSSSSSSSGSSSSSSSSAQATTPDAAATAATSGLFGNANTLMMHVSRPSRTETYAPFADVRSGGGRTSDLQSVAYFVTGQGGGTLQSLASQPGLARMAGDRLLMQTADQQGNTSVMAANTRILAPEVTSITFYYFDGTSWLTSWDSTSLAGLPKAVEVVLELAPLPSGSLKRGPSLLPDGESAIYRLVVSFPAGKPGTTTSTSTSSTSSTTGM